MLHFKNRAISLSAPLRRLTLAAAMGVLCTLAIASPPCQSDLDDNGLVETADIGLMLLDFGSCPPVEPPSISTVSPAVGTTAGGTTITITGSALTDASSVTVGGQAATVLAVGDSIIVALTQASSPGVASVVVTTPGGTVTASDAFTYGNASPPPIWCTVLEQSPNATVVHDFVLRAAMTATGLPWRVLDTGTGIEMVLIPPGTFTMGYSLETNYSSKESPRHSVTLTKAFYLSRTEVTQAQWEQVMGSNPSFATGAANNPVEQISWDDTQWFCMFTDLRLPTEAEWEFACRARTITRFHGMPGYLQGTNDQSNLGTIAWWSSNGDKQTHAVAGKAANGFGLYDMIGNVWEMCQDSYGTYDSAAQTNPTGSVTNHGCVKRGGSSFDSGSEVPTSSRRDSGGTDSYDRSVGFRVARSP
jgi:formylglycine-generating enzyme required for sulfatase activity